MGVGSSTVDEYSDGPAAILVRLTGPETVPLDEIPELVQRLTVELHSIGLSQLEEPLLAKLLDDSCSRLGTPIVQFVARHFEQFLLSVFRSGERSPQSEYPELGYRLVLSVGAAA